MAYFQVNVLQWVQGIFSVINFKLILTERLIFINFNVLIIGVLIHYLII